MDDSRRTSQVAGGLKARYEAIRAFTETLCAPLCPGDHVVQSMPDASPKKWHLAHTTWFFETFVLSALGGYAPFDARSGYLSNSYYVAAGARHGRPQRGLLSRPTVDESVPLPASRRREDARAPRRDRCREATGARVLGRGGAAPRAATPGAPAHGPRARHGAEPAPPGGVERPASGPSAARKARGGARRGRVRLRLDPSAAQPGATSPEGNFAESGRYHPAPPATPSRSGRHRQLFGDVWEWTASAYSPYPGFRPRPGALGEYNGKFMSGQLVLRGGSCATPRSHLRATHRNFFPPEARWQMSGLRLARGR